MDIKNDFNLRENADIVHLAMECAKSLDSTELKKWFDKKYAIELPSDVKISKEILSIMDRELNVVTEGFTQPVIGNRFSASSKIMTYFKSLIAK